MARIQRPGSVQKKQGRDSHLKPETKNGMTVMGAAKQGYVIPDKQDFLAVELEYGRLAFNASDADAAEYYRLAIANKLIREVEEYKTAKSKKKRKHL